MRRLETFPPSTLVAVVALLQVVLWTLIPAVVHAALPIDVVESTLWGREGILLSYKHPNLPGLLLEASDRLTGAHGWPAYLLSQLFVAATYGLVFRLGCDLIEPRAAAAGTLLLTGCYYFSWPTPEFNHNVAQMPFWAAFALVLWRAAKSNALALWLLTGSVAALGVYAKFSTGLLIAAGALWLLVDRRARACLATPAPWLGLAMFAATLAPLLIQLVRLDFLPFAYMMSRTNQKAAGLAAFVAAQVADVALMPVVVALAFWQARRPPPEASAPNPTPTADGRRAGSFLLILTLVPIAIASLVALASGAQDMWGAPMFNLVGLLVVLPLRSRLDGRRLARVAAMTWGLAVLVPAAYAGLLLALPVSSRATKPPLRALWPEAAIERRMADIWSTATHRPLGIVGGDNWDAGLVAVTHPDKPSLYIDLDARHAPWITPERLRRQGILLVWDERAADDPPPRPVQALIGRTTPAAQGEESFAWSRSATQPPFKLRYSVIAPSAN